MIALIVTIGSNIRTELDSFFLKDVTGPSRMPRADVAKYLLYCIPRTEEFRRSVAIGL